MRTTTVLKRLEEKGYTLVKEDENSYLFKDTTYLGSTNKLLKLMRHAGVFRFRHSATEYSISSDIIELLLKLIDKGE